MNRERLRSLAKCVLAGVVIAAIVAAVGCADVGRDGRPRTMRDAILAKYQPSRSCIFVLTNGLPEFRQYDQAICDEISKRWYALLDNLSQDDFRAGKVVVNFHLHNDGRVTAVATLENTTSALLGLLCEKAVLDPQPYLGWPQLMKEKVGKDYRELNFTFYYNN